MAVGVTVEGLSAVAKGCRELETLSLAWLPGLSAAHVDAIAAWARALRHLDLSGGQDCVGDAQVGELARGCPRLETLDLRYPGACALLCPCVF